MTNPKPEPPRTGIVQDCNGKMGNDSFLDAPAPTPEPQSCQRCGRFNNAHPLPDCPTFHEAGTPETTRPAAEINAEDDGTFIDLGTPETPSALPSCQEPLGSGRWCGLPLLHSGDHEAAEGETPSALTAHKAFARPECLAIEREAADLREKRSTAERQRDKAADVLCEIAIIVDAEPGPIPPAIQRLKLRAEAAEAELARVTESVRNICENSNPTYRTRVGQVLAFLDGLQERERKGE